MTSFHLFTCALALLQAPTADPVDWQLTPRVARGHELVYRGSYSEEATGAGAQFQRSYRLENRVFVLQATVQGLEVAILTIWKGPAAQADATAELEKNSIRLELGRVSPQGRLRGNGNACWAAPLDGPPTIEGGAFVEVPPGRLASALNWQVPDDDRPSRRWQIVGFETVNGVRCVKLAGLQQSEDWDRPRADRLAWRRRDTVWLAPRGGFAVKVERTIERREPARKEPSQRLVVNYELDSNFQYPDRLYEERRKEITAIKEFTEAVEGLLPRAAELGARPFELQLQRIKQHVQQQSPTPYREALRRVQQRAEAGKRGETPPAAPPPADAAPVAQVVSTGRAAPDFLAIDLVSRQSVRLQRWLGKPILLLFYNPAAAGLTEEVLHFAQSVSDKYRTRAQVVGLAVSEDVPAALHQCSTLKLTFPLLSGTGLRQSYAVEATPKLIVLDAAGIVQGSYVGWGPEAPHGVLEDLDGCLRN